jgi:G:T-mismatch repair DNA endonuclease (very short patch repair protein)
MMKNNKNKHAGMKFPIEKYPNYGMRNKKHSEEAKEKMSINNSSKRPEIAKKISLAKKGISFVHSGSFKKGQHPSPETEFKKGDKITFEAMTKMHKALEVKPNKPEKILINLIQKNNLPFNYVGDSNFWLRGEFGAFNPDFLSKNPRHIIEVYGDYWHNREDVKKRDIGRIKTYEKYGYKTLVIWEHELKSPSQVLTKIQEFIGC